MRRTADLASAFSHNEDYIPHEDDELNAVDVTLEYSRPLRALKLWLALRVARFFVKLVLLALAVAIIIGAYFYFF